MRSGDLAVAKRTYRRIDSVSLGGLICPIGCIRQILAHGAEMLVYNPGLGTSSMTMSFGARPKLLFLFQGFAVLMGLASAFAALPVAVLSFRCHGVAMLLGRVRPLRDTYH